MLCLIFYVFDILLRPDDGFGEMIIPLEGVTESCI